MVGHTEFQQHSISVRASAEESNKHRVEKCYSLLQTRASLRYCSRVQPRSHQFAVDRREQFRRREWLEVVKRRGVQLC